MTLESLQRKKNTFTCEMCHQTYELGWSDEEARDEAKDVFGDDEDTWIGGAAVVCDDCYHKIGL